MKMKKQLSTALIAFAILFELAACTKSSKQGPSPVGPVTTGDWHRVDALPASKISLLEKSDSTIYAAAATGILYSSTNNGKDWKQCNLIKANTQITALAVFKGDIYVGTFKDGIFKSPDNGNTWTNESTQIKQVSSFTVLNDHLYSSSRESGWVFQLNETPATWSPYITKGMPTNNNFNVEKILVVNQTLFSVQGTNGTFYTYDQGLAQWDEHFYRTTYTPGLIMTNVLANNEELYAVYSPAILRSENAGSGWAYDTVGLKRGGDITAPRVIYMGTQKTYTVLSVGDHESWLQERDKNAAIGSTWKNNDQHLLFGYSYGFCEIHNTLYLATEQGLFYKSM